tara:strand:- start:765 stop:1124 length:360 start_codon:yes stop_codon:yes gene_type:complete
LIPASPALATIAPPATPASKLANPNWRTASATRLTFSLVHIQRVLGLKTPRWSTAIFLADGHDAVQPNSLTQLGNRQIPKVSNLTCFQVTSRPFGVNAEQEKELSPVDVANASDDRLVQ